MEILLEGRGLTRRFQKKGQTIEAVHEVSFTLQKGTALGIAGASGSGKSTLARMAAGLLLPSEGKLLFHGSPLEGKEGLRHLWKQLQMIFQMPRESFGPALDTGGEHQGRAVRAGRPRGGCGAKRQAGRGGMPASLEDPREKTARSQRRRMSAGCHRKSDRAEAGDPCLR